MDAQTITTLVGALVQASAGEINAKVERCIQDCKELQNKYDDIKERVDINEGADLKTKLDQLLADVQGLQINDARQTEQLITVFKQLGMEKEAKQAQSILKVDAEGNVQINQGDNRGANQD